MKHTRLVVTLVVLLAAGLGLACDNTPTSNWDPELWAPKPCPEGVSPMYGGNCYPQPPPPPLPGGDGPSGP